MIEAIRFNCSCTNPASHWIELVNEMHRYRVQCGCCGKFIKWGKEKELHDRVALREKISVSSYDPEDRPRPTTIEDFLD